MSKKELWRTAWRYVRRAKWTIGANISANMGVVRLAWDVWIASQGTKPTVEHKDIYWRRLVREHGMLPSVRPLP